MYYQLTEIKGIGPKVLKKLNQNKIYNPYQLVSKFPKLYDNFTLNNSLSHLDHNENVTVLAKVISEVFSNRYSKVPMITFSILVFDNVIEGIAFNQNYLANNLKIDNYFLISGKYNYNKNQIIINKVVKDNDFKNIVPKYNIEGISDSVFSNFVKEVLETEKVNVYETLPFNIINKYGLITRKELFNKIHFPKIKEDLDKSYLRLKYEEAYHFQKEFSKRVNVREKKPVVKYNLNEVKNLITTLPFDLTNDQKGVVNDIFKDYKKDYSTFRLIQGDVGSGKTVVALIAALGMLSANFQVAFMAPTELLAKQQYEYFKKYLKNYNVALMTSTVRDKNVIKEQLKNGKINFLIGTHAVASDDVVFNNLGLIIIDEQHKFGVNIRKKLTNKGNANLIYLTATPIPRTLAITLFGEARVSFIKEKPKDRKEVKTIYTSDDNISNVVNEIKDNVLRNEKTFIVVPAIKSLHAKYNIENVYKLLVDNNLDKETIKIHGMQKVNDREKAIKDFLIGNRKILLATSMIEVGIDIFDATLMIIFSAEYFGLSQLHQLRGRVGRSNLESKCILVGIKEEKERLEMLTKTNDGFVLSEFDLKLRGPGALIGFEQSGNLEFKILDFIKDFEILQAMNQEFKK